MNWRSLISRYLPGLQAKGQDVLLRTLTRSGARLADQLGAAYARGLIKGIDAVAAALVQAVDRELITADQARGFMLAWVRAVRQEATELAQAGEVYAPFTMEVELAKLGDDPKLVAQARENRKAAKASLSEEAREFLEAFTGGGD